MHILDTDTLSLFQRGNENVKIRLATAKDYELGISIITKAEILRGKYEFLLKTENSENIAKAQKWLAESENLLAQIPIVYFDL